MNKVLSISKSLKCEYVVTQIDEATCFEKKLTLNTEPWIELFKNEIEFYLQYSSRPVFQQYVPRLIKYSLAPLSLVLEFIPGKSISTDRYSDDIDHFEFQQIMFALKRFNSEFQRETKKEELNKIVSKVQASRVLGDATKIILEEYSNRIEHFTFCHGDFLPKNLIRHQDGKIQIIDWEFYGHKPPFWDHALLWISIKNIQYQQHIFNSATIADQSHSFLLALAYFLERELNIHQSDEGLFQGERSYLHTCYAKLEKMIHGTRS